MGNTGYPIDPDTHQMVDMTARNSVVLTDQDRLLTGNFLNYNAKTTHTEVLKIQYYGTEKHRYVQIDLIIIKLKKSLICQGTSRL